MLIEKLDFIRMLTHAARAYMETPEQVAAFRQPGTA